MKGSAVQCVPAVNNIVYALTFLLRAVFMLTALTATKEKKKNPKKRNKFSLKRFPVSVNTRRKEQSRSSSVGVKLSPEPLQEKLKQTHLSVSFPLLCLLYLTVL